MAFGEDVSVTHEITRRGLFGSLAATALGAAGATGSPLPDGALLMVAGPGGGAIDMWADWLATPLSRALSPGAPVHKDIVGGPDGVTAANQFEALTVADGRTALLLPGSAAMARLIGDPRAQFDLARWVPALAGVTPGLVVSRLPMGQAINGARLRVAASRAAGPELPALLALDLLGAEWVPVFGLSEAAATDALAQGQVDAVCLHGRGVADLAQSLAPSGMQPLFSFGSLDESGQRQRDPAFPAVPTAYELFARQGGHQGLRNAWSATAAASDLDMALVLPQLTPAAMVALWRRATAQAMGPGGVAAQATALGVRSLLAPAAIANTGALLADQATQLDLRRWLSSRLNYKPS